MRSLLVVLVFCTLHHTSSAQAADMSVKDWVKKLSDPADRKNEWYEELELKLTKLDSSKTFIFLDQLEQYPDAKGDYFMARFNCIKASLLYVRGLYAATGSLQFKNEEIKKEVRLLLAQAMNLAYESNDDCLAAFVSGIYGNYMSFLGETEPAIMYLMNSADLYEKVNLSGKYQTYELLGEMLWRVREYEKSIKYSQKAISILPASGEEKDTYALFCSNTIALAYHKMGQYDSAFAYYRQGLKIAQKIDRPAWQGIISGNMGQIYFAQGKYTTALPLFKLDYTISNEKGYYDNAANSLQWTARTNLALGRADTALRQVREAFGLLQKWPSANYLQNTYFTAAEIFKALKNNDSSFYYSGLYTKLHDSLERVIYQNGISIAQLRLTDEKSRYSIMNLQQEKQAQAQQRNWIIAAILFLFVFALLLINGQRLRLKYQRQLDQQEMQSAKEQLQMFTESVIEKTSLIEKLEQQIHTSEDHVGQQEVITSLSNLTILTEEDWEKFKTLFEKIHPLFFQQLKSKAPDISLAEQRMAALTRLQLTTRQMASIQGISADTVYKTRQRLRHRLGISNETNLEEYLAVSL